MEARSGMPVGVELRTSDTPRARSFYGSLLGWDFAGGDGNVECLVDGAVAATIVSGGTDPDHWRVLLAVDGVPASVERVERGGGTVLRVASDAAGAVADVSDPLGASFSVADGQRGGPLDPGTARASWFEIMTSDADATDRFYGWLFGYRIEGPAGGTADGPFAVLRCGGRTIGGRLVLPPDLGALLGDRWMTYFAMPDVDDVVARAEELGGAVLAPPRDAPTGRVAALRDVAGAVFTVIAPRARA